MNNTYYRGHFIEKRGDNFYVVTANSKIEIVTGSFKNAINHIEEVTKHVDTKRY